MDKELMTRNRTLKMTIKKSGNTYQLAGNVIDNGQVSSSFQSSFSTLPATLNTKAGVIRVTKNQGHTFDSGRELFVTIRPPMVVAAKYVGSLSVAPTSKLTSIALITLKDQHPIRGLDFLRQLSICYNRQANADKNEIAYKTEEFINGRLEKINNELGTTEGALESYKRRNNLTQIRLDATETLQQTSQYSSRLTEANSQIQLLDYLRQHMDNPTNKYQIIPSNVGLTDGTSTSLINNYNKVVQDRNKLLRAASESSPQVMSLTSQLDELEQSLRVALLQARRSAEISRAGIENQYRKYTSKVASTPEQERILTQIGRQQEVKSGLYLMLLQKREENSISLSATADKGKLIDEPAFEGKVSPKGAIILLAALVLGIAIPMLTIYLLQIIRYKIEGREDVLKLTNLPIVADVAVANEDAKTSAGIVVHENKNEQTDEIFRAMRTNIQFMMKGNEKVILFTSSVSGEGKTFNAANLAVSFALLGKKVILCGLDIRKPALGRLFSIPDRESGITPLLAKDTVTPSDVKSQIQLSGVNKNLDLLLAGPTPPNPTELLARENMKQIIDMLREEYDYIILDTAPIGLVTDTLQIGKTADVCCFVCRADYTPKSSFGLINSLAAEEKLPNMCIVLNGVDMSKKKYGYYYGYGKYGKYGRYGNRYGYYGSYGNYGSYGYGNYSDSHYGNKEDKSIKR
jgi:capsular exopolysaccharide synthesis family protein